MARSVRKTPLERSIASVCPAALALWDPANETTPEETGARSNVKLAWVCPRDVEHRFTKRVFEIVQAFEGSYEPCPYCNGRLVLARDTLAARYPEVAAQWDAEYNKRPATAVRFDYARQSRFVCLVCDHRHYGLIRDLVAGKRCPKCHPKKRATMLERAAAGRITLAGASLAEARPDLLEEWDVEANLPLTAHTVSPHSSHKAGWVCRTNPAHRWRATVSNRNSANSRCPHCAKRSSDVAATDSLAALHPELAAEWDHERNDRGPEDVRPTSEYRAHWCCPVAEDHRWVRNVSARVRGSVCPACAGWQASVTNSVASDARGAALWHPTRNDKPAHAVSRASTKARWWQCAEHQAHEWEAPPVRVLGRGDGCTYCAGKRASATNSLAAKYPSIAAELDVERSGVGADEVVAHSHKRLHWVCSVDATHTWEAVVKDRTLDGIGCPWCYVPSTSRVEVDLACELQALLGGGEWNAARVGASGKEWRCDYSHAGLMIVVEYDDNFWHQDRAERDTTKTRDLEAIGWTVVRARERGLEPIGPFDIVMPSAWSVRSITRAVVSALAAAGKLQDGVLDGYRKRGAGLGADVAEALWAELRTRQVQRDAANGRAARMRRRRTDATKAA